ncbi:MAG TPA: hypothetical protein VD973_03840 [Symbiobacteriaceae bacterium]|nr:hypothetical protein [Symbiobacteriaceae bacterium]
MGTNKANGSGEQQPQEQKFIYGMAQDPAQAALEAAAKAAHQAALQAAANVQPTPTPGTQSYVPPEGEFRLNSRSNSRRKRRNLKDPFLWRKSPGTLIFGVASKWMLDDNAKARKVKMRNGQTMRIRCASRDNDPCIYFYVTHPLDPLGFDVEWVRGHWEANIAEWLFEEGTAPDPGINQKFDVVQSPHLILGLPVLCINTDLARETKHFDTSGKKKNEVDNEDPDTDDEDE